MGKDVVLRSRVMCNYVINVCLESLGRGNSEVLEVELWLRVWVVKEKGWLVLRRWRESLSEI